MRVVFDFGFLRQRKSGKKLRRSMRYRIQQPAQLGKPIPSFRRVAASFNKSMERTGASRSGYLQFLSPWRLAPAAHARR
jgi:hypothetical protein